MKLRLSEDADPILVQVYGKSFSAFIFIKKKQLMYKHRDIGPQRDVLTLRRHSIMTQLQFLWITSYLTPF